MPDTEIGLHVPAECIRCGAHGTIKLQTSLYGDVVTLEWCCTVCNAEWPVKRRDELPRPK
jgi:hypothetical protein